jgi:RNA-binding protein
MHGLSSAQRKQLRALAHHLDPVVYVGKQGLSEALVQATHEALRDHELIKVKFNDQKEQKRPITSQLADMTSSAEVGLIGNIAILYRQHPDPEQRRVPLAPE